MTDEISDCLLAEILQIRVVLMYCQQSRNNAA